MIFLNNRRRNTSMFPHDSDVGIYMQPELFKRFIGTRKILLFS